MREKTYFVAGVFMFVGGLFGCIASLYLGYLLISAHFLIGVAFMWYGLKWAMKPFETKEGKTEVTT